MSRPTPNSIRVNADAEEVVRRILRTATTIKDICAEYGVCHATVQRILYQRCDRKSLRRAKARKISRKMRGRVGHSAWNKGMTGLHLSPATQWKPGRPYAGGLKRWRAVGFISIRFRAADRGNVRWIKVRDDGPNKDRWMQYARWVWLQAGRTIPAGYRIVHKDGDSLNDSLGNLICVTGGDSLFLCEQRDPRMVDRRNTRAARARRERAEIERALSAAKKARAA